MIALVLAPVAASYYFYYFRPSERTANYGELIGPHPLPEAKLALADGTPFELSRLRGKWVLVTVDSGRCDAHCEKKLLYMRQLRLTQGKDQERVERAWLISDETAPAAELLARYAGTWPIRAAGAPLLGLFPAREAAADHIYVIDPLGNLMLRFPRDPDPGRMVKDLARLLKISRVG
ncbi:MAG TPA: cytochrome C oxidase subunit I [Burkholderiales bacterium]|nr:cytochrome C oxidase subunit I [Burkholderiales bacterium]